SRGLGSFVRKRKTLLSTEGKDGGAYRAVDYLEGDSRAGTGSPPGYRIGYWWPAWLPDRLLGAGLAADQRPRVAAGEGDRKVEGCKPDRDDSGVDDVVDPRVDADGFKESAGVGKQDYACHRCTQDPRVQVTHQPGRERRGEDAADEQRGDDAERYLREAQRDQEPKASAEGHDELACVHGTHDLARLHTPAAEKGR